MWYGFYFMTVIGGSFILFSANIFNTYSNLLQGVFLIRIESLFVRPVRKRFYESGSKLTFLLNNFYSLGNAA
jgi:hypothetical protein